MRATLVLVLFLIQAASWPALAAPCQCIDRGDIQQRLKEARAAVAVYRKQIEVIRAQEQRTGVVVTLNDERREKLQGLVQEALNEVARLSRRIPTLAVGSTSRQSLCIPEIVNPAASSCIRASVLAHEAVHEKACRGSLKWNETLIGYAQEEIAAYEAEIDFLEYALARLPCDYRRSVEYSGSTSAYERALKCRGLHGDWLMELGVEGGMAGSGTSLKVTVTFRLDEATLSGRYDLRSRYDGSVVGCDAALCGTGAGTAKILKEQGAIKLVFVPDGPNRTTICRNTCRAPVPLVEFPQPLAPEYELEEGIFCR